MDFKCNDFWGRVQLLKGDVVETDMIEHVRQWT